VRRIDTPPHTRLILAAEDLLGMFGTRTDDGRKLTAEWGEPSPEGWYEPTFTANGPPELEVARERANALALLYETASRERDAAIALADELAEVLTSVIADDMVLDYSRRDAAAALAKWEASR
jgi:hypothetical protein